MRIEQILLCTILFISSIVISSPIPGNAGQLLGKIAGDIRCTTKACFQHTPVKLSQKVGKMFSNMGKSIKKSNSNFAESFKSTYSPLRENEIKFKLDQNEIKTKKTSKKAVKAHQKLSKYEERLAELSIKRESLSGQSSSYQHSSNSIPRNSVDSVEGGSYNSAVRQMQPPEYDSVHRVSSGRISTHHSPSNSREFPGSPSSPLPIERTDIVTKLGQTIGSTKLSKSITSSPSNIKVARSTIDSSTKLTKLQTTKKSSFVQSLVKPFTKSKEKTSSKPIEAQQKYQDTQEILKNYREKMNSLSERQAAYYKNKGKSFDGSKLSKPISSSPSTSNRGQTKQLPRSKSML